jgi:hypothetical protein
MIDPNPLAYAPIDQQGTIGTLTRRTAGPSRVPKKRTPSAVDTRSPESWYLGDNWPSEYRGHLFTLNLHGLRASQEISRT